MMSSRRCIPGSSRSSDAQNGGLAPPSGQTYQLTPRNDVRPGPVVERGVGILRANASWLGNGWLGNGWCRAWPAVGLPSRHTPVLALGLLALTRLGFGLDYRAVLDVLGLIVVAQAGNSELLVLLAALEPACFQGLLGERARSRHPANGVELLAHGPEVGGQPVE